MEVGIQGTPKDPDLISVVAGHTLTAVFSVNTTYDEAKRCLHLQHLHMQRHLDNEIMKLQQKKSLKAALKSTFVDACVDALIQDKKTPSAARSKYDDLVDADAEAYKVEQEKQL